ncbi:MAG: MYXO-CTERM sorting domain-containing protein [Myxococcota bacterium]
MTALLLLFACTPEPEPEPEPPPTPQVVLADLQLPSDPWSPIRVDVRGGVPPIAPSMTVEGPTGPVDLEVRWDGTVLVGTPVDAFEPGENTLVEVVGVDLDEPFDILPYGMDPGFAGLEVGDAFTLDLESGAFTEPPGIGPLVLQQLDHAFVLEITDVRDGEADYRVIVVEDDRACSGHSGTATVDAYGRLDWADPDLAFPLLGSTTRLYDASLRLGILDDTLGGVRIAGVLDTAPLGPGLIGGDAHAFCELAATFGIACLPCPDTGEETCTAIEYTGGRGVAFDIPWEPGATMSACVIDPDPQGPVFDIPPIDCEPVSCSTHGPSAAWGLVPLVLAVLRRRRSR